MGKIRSAWEIALEKTESISVDKEKIRSLSEMEKARKIIGSYLNDEGSDADKKLDEISSVSEETKKDALRKAVLNSISLSSNVDDNNYWKKIETLVSLISPQGDAISFLGEIAGYIKQYPEHKKQLIERMKAQYQPVLEEKEEQLRRQYGEDVHLSLDSDKEFIQLATQNLKKLEEQYDTAIQNAKKELEELLK